MGCTMSRTLSFLALLTLLAQCALCASIPLNLDVSVRDMKEMQLLGNYQNVPLGSGNTVCPSALGIRQVEPIGTPRRQLFVIPHRYMSVPNYPKGQYACFNSVPPAGSITNFSSTVLQRSKDVTLDRSIDLLDKFALADEEFFIGHEIGDRVCNGYTLPTGVVSMWMAPSNGRLIVAKNDDYILRFQGGFKYIYFFTDPPCLYQGDARIQGRLINIPSQSPTPSPTPRPSIPPVVPRPPTGEPGTTGDGGPVDSGFQGGDGRPTGRPNEESFSPNSTTRVCFPAGSRVRVLRRGFSELARIEDLCTGDMVHDGFEGGKATFSRVLGLSHADADVISDFVLLRAQNLSLALSPTHFIVTVHGIVPARTIVEGDVLYGGEYGRQSHVVAVHTVRRRGLFSPVTVSGTIVVNDVVASVYTEALLPSAAHAALAPLRAFGGRSAMSEVVAWASHGLRWGAMKILS